jgi:hypothetical protein
MSEKLPADRIRLTLDLPAELARRLELAAAARRRTAAELAIELLAQHLPRSEPGGPTKLNIPYT